MPVATKTKPRCNYRACEEESVSGCALCERNFCGDHGSPGGDRPSDSGYDVAYPALCWEHGGFNVDEM